VHQRASHLVQVETPPGWIGVETKRAVNGAAVTAIVLDGPAAKSCAGDVEVVREEDFEAEIASPKPGAYVLFS